MHAHAPSRHAIDGDKVRVQERGSWLLRTFAVTQNERRAIAELGNPSLALKKTPLKYTKATGVSPFRDGAALVLRHGKGAQKPGDTILNTAPIDVLVYSERAEQRASVLARRLRATA